MLEDSEQRGGEGRDLSQPCVVTLKYCFQLEPWIFYPCMTWSHESCSGHLENTDSLNYAHFLNVTFYYTVSGNHDQYHRGYHQKRLEVLQNCQAHGGRYEFSKILIPA